MNLRRLFALVVALLGCCVGIDPLDSAPAAEPNRPVLLEIHAKSRDGQTGAVRSTQETLVASQTAIVICDMWDRHWCQSASRRVAEMAERMSQAVSQARELGVFVIHAPSDTMAFYEGTPQRQRARTAPPAGNLPPAINGWCGPLPAEGNRWPIDQSDGGCDCEPKCETGRPWARQIETIEVAAADAVSDRGDEIWNLLETRGIRNVVLMGVHTNMCVIGRPFGLRQMARNGKNVYLARDLTDSMYDPRQSPFVPHDRGTELVVQHIERYVCPTLLSADLVGDPPEPQIVFVIGEREYETAKTLPAFAAREIADAGFGCTFIHADSADGNSFPGLEALETADLLVLSVRRRALPESQLARIRRYVEAGRPVIGIRTASHAFDVGGNAPEGHAEWPAFDREVLGGHYHGHYSGDQTTFVRAVQPPNGHAILTGIPRDDFRVGGSLYKTSPLADGCTLLMQGRIEGAEPEPVAWTNTYRGGRVFYTSLGHPRDFEIPAFRRLLLNAVLWAVDQKIP